MPLKYTGSKRWMTKVLRPIDEVYEPFCGSGVVSFEKSTICHLNDQLEPLIAVYKRLQIDKQTFVKELLSEVEAIKSASNSSAAYYDARARYNAGGMSDPVLFCVIIYLGFNGLYRVGPNGCNVPYGGDSRRFNPKGLMEIPIEKVKTLSCGSWDARNVPNEDCTIYVDPPYATTFTGYTRKGWAHADNVQLFGWLAEQPNPVLISCLRTEDNEQLLTDLNFDFVSMDKIFSNGTKSVKKGEILAFNDRAVPHILFREVRR